LNFPISENTYSYIEVRGGEIISEKHMTVNPELEVVVIRNGSPFTIKSSSETISNALLSSSFYSAFENYYPKNILESIKLGFMHGNNLLSRMGEIIASLFSGGTKLSEFAGPIGLVNMVGQASQGGLETLVFLTALITLNLGLFNLLPLPALDGGRIIFNIVEMIIRKKINPIVEGYIHAAGFLFLMGMMVYVTYFDIMRLFK
jgi:regulator of sigma E protease